MARSRQIALAAAFLASIGATFAFGSNTAHALDLDDLADELPPIRRVIPVPVPTGPVIVIPIDIDD